MEVNEEDVSLATSDINNNNLEHYSIVLTHYKITSTWEKVLFS